MRKPPATGNFRGTPKQMAVLRSIVRRNPDGSLLDIVQLMDMHGNGASRMAMRQTLGYLESHGLIRRAGQEFRGAQISGKPRRLFEATDMGRAIVRPRTLPSADG
ncbi:hypothetical protein ACQKOE_07795 [Novosphingobium sp. NPDC080210]|uniref:hypothetical protein n=1 Tax=Novosphingobium sp. NPDC080210 TaxID=3390596 RepID=UPI003D03D89C